MLKSISTKAVTDLYPQTPNPNEHTPLQIQKQAQDAETNQTDYLSTRFRRHTDKYEKEEKCLQHWLTGCMILMALLIPITELIMLIMYFPHANRSLLCPLQSVWTYFILSKLAFEAIAVLILVACACNRNFSKKGLYIVGAIIYLWLLIWDITLTAQLLNNTIYTDSATSCSTLMDFILFEAVSVWALVLLSTCIAFWMLTHGIIVNILSIIAHMMHKLVLSADITIFYQWTMSIVELVFLAIYYNNYGNCDAKYGKYILAKLIMTVVVIACDNFLIKCCDKQVLVLFAYIVALCIWCVAASVVFWRIDNDNEYIQEDVECRTNHFTSHYFDFMMLDIILGYVVIAKVFCSACWIQLSNYLGSPQIVERYGEFAKSNTAEWLKYKETRKR